VKFHVVIPARYASSRLPGKSLLDIAGKPMIQHVYERALESGAEEVIVATDDQRIADAVGACGATVCMTRTDHKSGTDRIAEVAAARQWPDDQIVVNLQGDEPMMPPGLVSRVAHELQADADAVMSTVCVPTRDSDAVFDPNIVKVVMDASRYALYFSRAPIPWSRDTFSGGGHTLPEGVDYYRQFGLYAYRAGFLRMFTELSHCPLEDVESLEQLRALYHGYKIRLAVVDHEPPHGVDTPEDLGFVIEAMTAL